MIETLCPPLVRSKDYSREMKYVVGILLVLLWVAYFIGAMYSNFKYGFDRTNEPAIRLIAVNALAVFCVLYWAVKKYYGYTIWKSCLGPCYRAISGFMDKYWHILKW